ncbi:MAG: hypothetical protein ACE5R4_13335 [Armatimonadota bacterium]
MSIPHPQQGRPFGTRLGVLAAVFLVALSVLSLEIALTRVFSVLLRYHHLFVVLSLAVCGLGFGGLLDFLALRPLGQRLDPETLLSLTAWAAAATVLLTAWALLATPLVAHLTSLWLMSTFCFVPFLFCGAFLSCAFRIGSAEGGRLYAADLCGAAAGSLLVILALQAFGGTNALLTTAFTLSLAPLALAASSRRQGVLGLAALATVSAGMVVMGNVSRGWLDLPAIPYSDAPMLKRLYQQLSDPASHKRIVHTEWDAFARSDVVYDADPRSQLLYVYTDGEVPTQMIPFDGDLGESAYLMGIVLEPTEGASPECFVGFLPFLCFPADRMLSIGSGGGMDVHLGLLAGSRQIDCVDVNPALPRIMERFKHWHGDIYDRPNVELRIDEGRSFLRRASQPYDMIYMALIQTDTTTALSLNPVEAYSATREAMGEYLNCLTDDGTYVFIAHTRLFMLRAFLTALEAFQAEGLSRSQALNRVAMFADPRETNQPYGGVLVARRRAWTAEQGQRFLATVHTFGHEPVFVPGVHEPLPFSRLRQPDLSFREFLRQEGFPNLTPCTDDRPFFLDLWWGVPPRYSQFLAVVGAVAGALLLGVIAGVGLWSRRGAAFPAARPALLFVYFAALGLGFMLVEIAIAEKLIRALGYPALAVSAILFGLLLGGGVGSGLSQRWADHRLLARAAAAALLVALLLCAAYLGLDRLVELALGMPLWGRAALVVGVLLPVGMAMGTPFPSGVRVLGALADGLVPCAWAVNGVTSVLGGALALVLGKLWGFSHALLLGGGIYLLAAALALAVHRRGPLRVAHPGTECAPRCDTRP